jgi:hypothetical protein
LGQLLPGRDADSYAYLIQNTACITKNISVIARKKLVATVCGKRTCTYVYFLINLPYTACYQIEISNMDKCNFNFYNESRSSGPWGVDLRTTTIHKLFCKYALQFVLMFLETSASESVDLRCAPFVENYCNKICQVEPDNGGGQLRKRWCSLQQWRWFF